jgi:hypothetical protein
VYDAAPRQSFVAALKDVPEVWEISYNPKADDIPDRHDPRLQVQGRQLHSRLPQSASHFLSEPLDDFLLHPGLLDRDGRRAREAGKGQVVHLDVRKKIADLKLPGMPHLGSGITWKYAPPARRSGR